MGIKLAVDDEPQLPQVRVDLYQHVLRSRQNRRAVLRLIGARGSDEAASYFVCPAALLRTNPLHKAQLLCVEVGGLMQITYPTVTWCKRLMTPSPPLAVSDDTDLCD